ncbi:DNA-directed RNA polymerase III subunit RPC8 [Ischnura elegans]|uniref:DNA-directed RNA polymerase III subunit RPC8 n=1 Tax=Ischnura elegans TaxID=197161 RepID=UPI001ED8AF33|nr:DNA-directed RNA polymerase III subunit RPC8 [Ischnura elegans]
MFVLSEMKHVVRIPPHKFHMNLNDAIYEELNKKLANKVVLGVGLVVALRDLKKLEDSYVFPGDGASHTKVNFRCVVFRPFMEEILVGKIRSSSREGVMVTLGFFEDILIPPLSLQYPSRFDEVEQVWVWEYQPDGEQDDSEKHNLFMDPGESIRFRVTSEAFADTTPGLPDITADGTAASVVPTTQASTSSETAEPEPKVPYSLTGTINEPGLGLLSWWSS